MKTVMKLIAVACFAGAAFAQQPNQPPKPGPEYQELQLWVIPPPPSFSRMR
ncbi:MAG: hypothetical protein WAN12_06505 [Candidatus Acidiferrum sp.]|jgi:hypothetical protein